MVGNVNILYGYLKSENSQDYAQKPQQDCMFMNSASGFRWMRERKAYRVKRVMLAYNLFQTLFSAWGFSHGWR
jgi:hypothetical protein